jgi:hypothetical protein
VSDERFDKIEGKLDTLLDRTARFDAIIYPSPGQPSVIEDHAERISKLEGWRNFLAGAWTVVTVAFSVLFGLHHHKG